jgi:hypothetical protein
LINRLAAVDRLSVAQYRALNRKRSKYGAKAIIVDGRRFQSRLEANRYLHWQNMWQLGVIRWFIRQVPFELPGGIVYRCDFFIIGFDDVKERIGTSVTIEDCKGVLTRLSATKIAQVEHLYGVKIDIIKKARPPDAIRVRR